MQYAYELARDRADEDSSTRSTDIGRLVRITVFGGFGVYSGFAIVALLIAPALARTPVVWAPMAMAAAVAVFTIYAGDRLQRR